MKLPHPGHGNPTIRLLLRTTPTQKTTRHRLPSTAFLLIPALLFLCNGALADDLVAAKSLKKGTTPPALSRRQATNGGDSDGCPSGWAECSITTCYPLDGSQCCSDGNYCDAGYTCVTELTGDIKCRRRLSGTGLSAGPAGGAALAGLLDVAVAYMG